MNARLLIIISFGVFVLSLGTLSGCNRKDEIDLELSEFIDPRSSSSGSVERGIVLPLTKRGFQRLNPNCIAVSGHIQVYRIPNDDSVIAVRSRTTLLLLHHPSIRVSRLANLDISAEGLTWMQPSAHSKVMFYFSLEKQRFVYVRRTLVP